MLNFANKNIDSYNLIYQCRFNLIYQCRYLHDKLKMEKYIQCIRAVKLNFVEKYNFI